MNPSHLPNAITLLRMFSALPLAWLILQSDFSIALWLFAFASLSDALDGWLARHYHWQSKLGGYIDPLADKLLLFAAYVPLAIQELLPLWLALLVVARDLVIVAGAVAWNYWRGPLQAQPMKLSRINTFLQILLAASVLAAQGLLKLPASLLQGGIWLVTFSTVASGLSYVMLWAGKQPDDVTTT